MTSTNLEIMRGVYAAFARRDLDTIRAAIHPDFVMEQQADLPWGGRRHGPDGFFAFLGTLLSYLDPTIETEDLYDSGDHIIQVGHTHGIVRETGHPFRAREIHVWQLRDEKIVFYQVHIDVAAMQAALDGAPAS